MKKITFYLKQTAREWSSHNPLLLGAAISFYIVLASGPVLTLLIMVFGSWFGEQLAEGRFINEVNSAAGNKLAVMISSIIKKATTSDNRVSTLITSIPLMVFGSTMVFLQIKNALDTLWDSNIKSDASFTKKLKEYLLAVIMLFVTGAFFFLLMAKTFVISSGDDFFANISSNPLLPALLNIIVTFILVTFFFALLYKILIKYKMRWKHILTGAVVTSVLFSAAQLLLGLNFKISNIESAYGAIGYFTLWILWIFYSSLVFLFGASFLKIYCRDKGNNEF
jgi:membrane protein